MRSKAVPALSALLGRGNVQLALGLLALAAIVMAARLSVPEFRMPEGWSVLRPPVDVNALVVQNELLWVGGKDGLVALDRKSSRLLPPSAGEPEFRYAKDLLVDRSGVLWVAHDRGVTRRLAGGQWSDFEEFGSLLPGAGLSFLEDRDGTLWMGGEGGVLHYEAGKAKLFRAGEGMTLPSVDVIFQDREGVHWFGSASPTQGGLARYDGQSWRLFTVKEGLVHNAVNAILQDRQGALWFGLGFHDRGGANRLFNGEWTTLTRDQGLAGEKVRSLLEDREGRLWFGSEYDGVAIYDGVQWRSITPREGLASWEAKRMIQDPDGTYWIGTTDGLSRLEKLN